MVKISKQNATLLAQGWYMEEGFSCGDALLFAQDWADYEPLRKNPFELANGFRIEHVPGDGFYLRQATAAELAADQLAAEIVARWAA